MGPSQRVIDLPTKHRGVSAAVKVTVLLPTVEPALLHLVCLCAVPCVC